MNNYAYNTSDNSSILHITCLNFGIYHTLKETIKTNTRCNATNNKIKLNKKIFV